MEVVVPDKDGPHDAAAHGAALAKALGGLPQTSTVDADAAEDGSAQRSPLFCLSSTPKLSSLEHALPELLSSNAVCI